MMIQTRGIARRFIQACNMLMVVLLSSGCATIVNGSKQQIHISSDPPGACVTIGLKTLTTPGCISLARNGDYQVEIAKPGFETKRVYLHREFNSWMWSDILFVTLVVPLTLRLFRGICGSRTLSNLSHSETEGITQVSTLKRPHLGTLIPG